MMHDIFQVVVEVVQARGQVLQDLVAQAVVEMELIKQVLMQEMEALTLVVVEVVVIMKIHLTVVQVAQA